VSLNFIILNSEREAQLIGFRQVLHWLIEHIDGLYKDASSAIDERNEAAAELFQMVPTLVLPHTYQHV
jgi:hypothetical protein